MNTTLAVQPLRGPRTDNPGIVPPWLKNQPIPIVPDPDAPRIWATVPTAFDPEPIVADPDVPRIW